MYNNRKHYFMNPLGKVCSICLIDYHSSESLQFGSNRNMTGNLYSKTSWAWVILTEDGQQDHLLNIAPDEQILSVHRSRWLLIQRPITNVNVVGHEISITYTKYIYDMANSKTFQHHLMPEGRFICSGNGALDMNSGEITKNSLLERYELIDIEPLDTSTGPIKAELASSPIFSNSPVEYLSIQHYVYVLKSKTKNDYTIHVGPLLGPGIKLNTILTFSGIFYHCRGAWIAYNNRIHNLADQKKNIQLDKTTVSCGLVLKLSSVFFVSDSLVSLTYENENFQAIIGKTISDSSVF